MFEAEGRWAVPGRLRATKAQDEVPGTFLVCYVVVTVRAAGGQERG